MRCRLRSRCRELAAPRSGVLNADDLSRVFIVTKRLENMVDEIVAKACRRVGPPGKVTEALGVARTAVYRRLESKGLLPSDIPRDVKDSEK